MNRIRGGKLSVHRDHLDSMAVRLRADVWEAWRKIGV
jgi:hypothetical protein